MLKNCYFVDTYGLIYRRFRNETVLFVEGVEKWRKRDSLSKEVVVHTSYSPLELIEWYEKNRPERLKYVCKEIW